MLFTDVNDSDYVYIWDIWMSQVCHFVPVKFKSLTDMLAGVVNVEVP